MNARDQLIDMFLNGGDGSQPEFETAIEDFRGEVLKQAGDTLVSLGYEDAGNLLRDTADVVVANAPGATS